MFEDAGLDSFMEDHLNGGYGHIMDQCDGERCPSCSCTPCCCPNPDGCEGDDCSEHDSEPDDVRDEPDDVPDAQADSEWLASAGMGMDEDYGGDERF